MQSGSWAETGLTCAVWIAPGELIKSACTVELCLYRKPSFYRRIAPTHSADIRLFLALLLDQPTVLAGRSTRVERCDTLRGSRLPVIRSVLELGGRRVAYEVVAVFHATCKTARKRRLCIACDREVVPVAIR